MPLRCMIGWHRPAESDLWNNGYYFSHCERCSQPLIKRPNGKWQEVPKGKQIVWKPRTEWDIDWSAVTRDPPAGD